ncbi:conserved membrane hypothetical protein [Candidatus Terasakiella magnetica]|nr:conserved membrane hypothetical protein [Candidatus Terasakiella magnetica]
MSPDLAYATEGLALLDAAMIWLVNLPIWKGALLMIGLPVLVSIVGVLMVNAVVGSATLIENNVVGGAKIAFLAQVFCALLAFVLVDGAIRYNQARAHIQTEASALRLLVEIVEQVPGPKAAAMRSGVRHYVQAVVTHEFQTMQYGAESPTAHAALVAMLEGYMAIDAKDEHERLNLLQADQLVVKTLQSRAGRLNAVRPGLKTVIWTVVAFNVMLAITFNWFFGNPSPSMQVLMAALLTAAIMIVTYASLLLYHPFSGEMAISPRPYAALYP